MEEEKKAHPYPSSGEDFETERMQFLSMFDAMDEVVYVADPETHELLYMNAAARAQWGDGTGRKCHGVFQNLDSPCHFCTNDRIFGDNLGDSHTWEWQNLSNQRWYRCIDRAIRWPDGRMVRFEMAIDVTDLKLIEEVYRVGEKTYKTLAENIPGIVYRVHLRENGRMQFFNTMVHSVTGYEVNELGTGDVCSIEPCILPDDREYVVRKVRDAIREDSPFQIEYRLRHKNGSVVNLIERGRPIYGSDGKPEFIDGVIFDITENKSALSALQASEERYRLHFEYASDIVYSVDAEGRFIMVSPSIKRILGYNPGELIGRPFFETGIIMKEDIPKSLHDMALILSGREPENSYYRFITRDGTTRYGEFRINVVREADKVISIIGVARDITDKKVAEDALHKSEERYREIVEETDSIVIEIDGRGRFVFMNSAAEKLFGVPPGSCEGISIFEYVHDDDREKNRADFEKMLVDRVTRTVFENRIVAGGDVKHMLWTNTIRYGENQAALSIKSIGRDISEIRNAERNMVESEEKIRALMNATDDAVFLLDKKGTVIDMNRATYQRFGIQDGEMAVTTVYSLLPKDFWEARGVNIEQVLAGGETVRMENVYNGRWYETFVYPIVDAFFHSVSLAAVYSRDITELRDFERRIMSAIEGERRRIGQDLHDGIGQKLTAIGLIAGAMKKKLIKHNTIEMSDIEEIMTIVGDSIDHTKRISKGLMPVSLESYGLEAALEELAGECSSLPGVRCDFRKTGRVRIQDSHIATQLYYIAQESVNNAIKYGKAPGIVIRLFSEGNYIIMSVENSGGLIPSTPGRKGLGMETSKYRANLIGGEIRSGPVENGYIVEVRIRKDK